MQSPADPKDYRTASKQVIQSTALEIQHDRGVIYVYGSDGSPLLKITGLPRPIPDVGADSPAGLQLTIEILAQGVNCEWSPHPGLIRPSHAVMHADSSNSDSASVLKQAGATIVSSGTEPE